jgi:hypothetical protein
MSLLVAHWPVNSQTNMISTKLLKFLYLAGITGQPIKLNSHAIRHCHKIGNYPGSKSDHNQDTGVDQFQEPGAR